MHTSISKHLRNRAFATAGTALDRRVQLERDLDAEVISPDLRKSILLLSCVVAALGCPGLPTESEDAGNSDTHDAGTDADAGVGDAGESDAGLPIDDAGTESDAGPSDSGIADAGGSNPDDAGTADAGFFEDAGPSICSSPNEHNGGDGVCVATGVCSTDFFIRPDGICTPFRETLPFPEEYQAQVTLVTHGSSVYLIGDFDDFLGLVSGGEIVEWIPIAPFVDTDARRSWPSLAVVNDNEMVAVGGFDFDVDAVTAAGATYTAAILPDETLGPWTLAAGGDLVVSRGAGGAIFRDGALWIVGGATETTDLSSIERAPIDADGNIGAFSLVAAAPDSSSFSQIGQTTDTVVLAGYKLGANSTWLNVSLPGRFPDEWQSVQSLESNVLNICGVLDGHIVFGLGGGVAFTPGGLTTTDRVFAIDLDNVAAGWRDIAVLPERREIENCQLINDYVFTFGGRGGDHTLTPVASIWSARADALLRAVGGR